MEDFEDFRRSPAIAGGSEALGGRSSSGAATRGGASGRRECWSRPSPAGRRPAGRATNRRPGPGRHRRPASRSPRRRAERPARDASMRGWTCGAAPPLTWSAARIALRSCGKVSPPDIAPRSSPSGRSERRIDRSARGRSLTVSSVPIARHRSKRGLGGAQSILDRLSAAGSARRTAAPGSATSTVFDERRQAAPASRIGAADQQRAIELAADQRQAARGSPRTRASCRNSSGPIAGGAVAALARAASCRTGRARRRLCGAERARQEVDGGRAFSAPARAGRSISRLPPRCAGCGAIVDEVHSFCPDCWKQIEFLGRGGLPHVRLAAGGDRCRECAVCLAEPPRIARTRAAVAYDELSRGARAAAQIWAQGRARADHGALHGAAGRYGRRRSHPGAGAAASPAAVAPRLQPVGAGRPRAVAPAAASRPTCSRFGGSRRTPPLKGMSLLQRRRAVAGAFGVADPARVEGQDGHPGRRCADHRQHRRSLRAGAASGPARRGSS